MITRFDKDDGLSQVESVQDQYITRHLPDGRIIYADHRIATIAGYLPGEVIETKVKRMTM